MKSENLRNAYEGMILLLSDYLCVSKIIDSEEEYYLLIAPFSSGGRMHQQNEEIDKLKDIRVLHDSMYLWFENDNWIVEYPSGQMRPRRQFKEKFEAIKFVKAKIEEYWRKVHVPGG